LQASVVVTYFVLFCAIVLIPKSSNYLLILLIIASVQQYLMAKFNNLNYLTKMQTKEGLDIGCIINH